MSFYQNFLYEPPTAAENTSLYNSGPLIRSWRRASCTKAFLFLELKAMLPAVLHHGQIVANKFGASFKTCFCGTAAKKQFASWQQQAPALTTSPQRDTQAPSNATGKDKEDQICWRWFFWTSPFGLPRGVCEISRAPGGEKMERRLLQPFAHGVLAELLSECVPVHQEVAVLSHLVFVCQPLLV